MVGLARHTGCHCLLSRMEMRTVVEKYHIHLSCSCISLTFPYSFGFCLCTLGTFFFFPTSLFFYSILEVVLPHVWKNPSATDPLSWYHPLFTLAQVGTRTETDPGAMGGDITPSVLGWSTHPRQSGGGIFWGGKGKTRVSNNGFGTELATFCPLCQGALPAWTFVCAREGSVGSGQGEGYADRWTGEGSRVVPSSAQPPWNSPVSQLLGPLPVVGSGVSTVGGRGSTKPRPDAGREKESNKWNLGIAGDVRPGKAGPWSELAQLCPIVFLLCFMCLLSYVWYCKVAREKIVLQICVCAELNTRPCASKETYVQLHLLLGQPGHFRHVVHFSINKRAVRKNMWRLPWHSPVTKSSWSL